MSDIDWLYPTYLVNQTQFVLKRLENRLNESTNESFSKPTVYKLHHVIFRTYQIDNWHGLLGACSLQWDGLRLSLPPGYVPQWNRVSYTSCIQDTSRDGIYYFQGNIIMKGWILEDYRCLYVFDTHIWKQVSLYKETSTDLYQTITTTIHSLLVNLWPFPNNSFPLIFELTYLFYTHMHLHILQFFR